MTAPSVWRLGLRSLARDLRAGELRLLMLSVLLAVAALTMVGAVADRLRAALSRDAGALLGGDLVLASDQPVAADWLGQARALGLRDALTSSFPTMARAPEARGGATRLVALKAVESAYPLRGALRWAQERDAAGGWVERGGGTPAAGEVWVEPALLQALDVQLGDTLLLGEAGLRIAAVLIAEPDRGMGFTSFAPRVLMRMHDLPSTELVQPASRVSYRLALTGEPAAVARYQAWAEARLQQTPVRGLRLESLSSGRPEMAQALQRADSVLNLIALMTAVLAALALATSARSFALHHLDDCAMQRVLGLSQRQLTTIYAVELLGAALLACVAGLALGYGLHAVLLQWLQPLLQLDLPAPGLQPALLGLGVGLSLLLGFGLGPIVQLAQVPPLRVLRRDALPPRRGMVATLALALLALVLLVLATRDRTLALLALGGLLLAQALFAALALALLGLARWLVRRSALPRALALALRQMVGRPMASGVQIATLATGMLALVLLLLVRTDLLQSWRQSTPADAPDRFVINIQPDQAQAFRQALAHATVRSYDWYPMVRGRLVAVNNRPVRTEDYADERAQRLVEREFNLSYSSHAPAHNQVVEGRWLAEEAGALSLEEGLARTLNLRLGDVLRFDMAGVTLQGRITSIRKVDWGSLRANFFALVPHAQLDDVAVTYLAAFKAPANPTFDRDLVRHFPNVTVVDLSATLNQVEHVLGQLSSAVEFLFGLALLAGLLVLVAVLGAGRAEREREFAVLRALGATAALLRNVQRIELLTLGALAGLLAAAVAVGLAWLIAHQALGLATAPAWWVLAPAALAGAMLALAAGWWPLRSLLRRPVLHTLRAATE